MMAEASLQALKATPRLTQGFSAPGAVWGHISRQEEGRALAGPQGELSTQRSKRFHLSLPNCEELVSAAVHKAQAWEGSSES